MYDIIKITKLLEDLDVLIDGVTKIYKKMTANADKSCLPNLGKLVSQKNYNYHSSIIKNLLMLIILLWLKKLSEILKLLNLKSKVESELLSIKTVLVQVLLRIGQEKYLLLILFWKLILGKIKLKI